MNAASISDDRNASHAETAMVCLAGLAAHHVLPPSQILQLRLRGPDSNRLRIGEPIEEGMSQMYPNSNMEEELRRRRGTAITQNPAVACKDAENVTLVTLRGGTLSMDRQNGSFEPLIYGLELVPTGNRVWDNRDRRRASMPPDSQLGEARSVAILRTSGVDGMSRED